MKRTVLIGQSVVAAVLLASLAQGGVLPSSWSITTGVETQAFTSVINESDAAMSFYGVTESMVYNEGYEIFKDPPEMFLVAVAEAHASFDVRSAAGGWSIDSSVFARAGSDDANADASAFNTFDATFFIADGEGFLVNGELTEYGNKSSDFAGYGYGVRMEVYRNGALVFESDGWEDDFPGPQDLYSAFEANTGGAEYRLLLTSDAQADSYPGPGGWSSEAYMDYTVSVTAIPAPVAGLPLAGLTLLVRRRR